MPATAGPVARAPRGLVAGSLFAFMTLGLPDGMLGVAWPALRHGFGQPLAGLGELLLASVVGYLTVTSLTGSALRRFGTSAVLIGAAVLAAIGTATFTASPWWPALVVASAVLGAAGGGLDAALNTAIALAGRTRLMNLIHAAFGVGAAVGPLLITLALAATDSWRGGYAVLLACQVGLIPIWIGLRRAFPDAPGRGRQAAPPPTPDAPRAAGYGQATLVSLSLGLFVCYGGVEIAVGAWAASFLRGADHLSATLAGLAVFGYWASLAAGRLATAALGRRLTAQAAAMIGTLGVIAGTAGILADLTPAATGLALIVTGLCLGPIFPALINLTPGRLGAATAVHAVGWELAATGGGGAGLTALIGVVLQRFGLTSLGACVLALALGLAGLNMLVQRRARTTARRRA